MGEYLSKTEIAKYTSEHLDALVQAAVQQGSPALVKVPLIRIKPTLLERLFKGARETTYTDIQAAPIPHDASPWTDGAYLVPITTSIAGEKFRKTYLREVIVAVPKTWPSRTGRYLQRSLEDFVEFDVLNGNLERKEAYEKLERFKKILTTLSPAHE